MEHMTLYHGSSRIVDRPEYGKGRPYNDYGPGFYCTQHKELACEWACAEEGADGFASEYLIDPDGLCILDLSFEPYTVLHWLTVLLEHRLFETKTPIAVEGKRFLREEFAVPVDDFDIIIGHRADDSYFTFARSFLGNSISLEQLSRAMRLGDLGKQVVLKSRRAFERIEFVGTQAVTGERYYPRRLARDEHARALYREEAQRQGIEGIYLRDLLQGKEVDLASLR